MNKKLHDYLSWHRASQVALLVKKEKNKKQHLPANAGDIRDVGLIPRLGKFLKRGMTTPSSIFTWEIPCTEEPGGLQSIGFQRVGQNWITEHHKHFMVSFSSSISSKGTARQCSRCKRLVFSPCVGKIPRRGKCQPTLSFLLGWTEEPGGLQSTRSQRAEHNWVYM